MLAEVLGAYFPIDEFARGGVVLDAVGIALGVLVYAAVAEAVYPRFFLRRRRAIRGATHSG